LIQINEKRNFHRYDSRTETDPFGNDRSTSHPAGQVFAAGF
jgi:hypothetical protein